MHNNYPLLPDLILSHSVCITVNKIQLRRSYALLQFNCCKTLSGETNNFSKHIYQLRDANKQAQHHCTILAAYIIYFLRSVLFMSSATRVCTKSAVISTEVPCFSAASNDTSSTTRSITVCKRRAPMFSTVLFV